MAQNSKHEQPTTKTEEERPRAQSGLGQALAAHRKQSQGGGASDKKSHVPSQPSQTPSAMFSHSLPKDTGLVVGSLSSPEHFSSQIVGTAPTKGENPLAQLGDADKDPFASTSSAKGMTST